MPEDGTLQVSRTNSGRNQIFGLTSLGTFYWSTMTILFHRRKKKETCFCTRRRNVLEYYFKGERIVLIFYAEVFSFVDGEHRQKCCFMKMEKQDMVSVELQPFRHITNHSELKKNDHIFLQMFTFFFPENIKTFSIYYFFLSGCECSNCVLSLTFSFF